MKQVRLTDEMCEALYNGRSSIWIEGFTLARCRVAIRCVERVYMFRPDLRDPYDLSRFILASLDRQRKRSQPHPLHWEITAFVKHICQGGTRRTFYAGLCHTRAKRAIHKVMLGGRRERH